MEFTFFFRDRSTLDLVAQHAFLPRRSRGNFRIWDAGCSSGEEPYSLAILFAETVGFWELDRLWIDATDVEPVREPFVVAGRYADACLSMMNRDWVEKYFYRRPDDGLWEIDARLRARVKFTLHDLRRNEPIGYGFDAILCKNVLMHFTATEKEATLRMFHRALGPDGLLALDETERLPPEIEPLFVAVEPGARVYRRVDVG